MRLKGGSFSFIIAVVLLCLGPYVLEGGGGALFRFLTLVYGVAVGALVAYEVLSRRDRSRLEHILTRLDDARVLTIDVPVDRVAASGSATATPPVRFSERTETEVH
jgi:hypothetical protein